MADFTKSIKLVVDVVTGNASSGLKSLKSEIDNTEGAWGKMKVAGSGAFDFVKQNAAVFALGAGTAIAGFAAHAVGKFEDVALGAGELRDKLGVTAEEASRLQEVGNDLGIGTDALATAIGRMNKTAGSTPQVFDDIGASIAKNKDGTTDVNQTFLNVIDTLHRMPDAATRAAAAQKIFGKGWQSMAELIDEGAAGVKARLDEVQGAKIVSDAQIDSARALRDGLDNLRDDAENVTLALGKFLVPAVTEVADAMDSVVGPVTDFMAKLDELEGSSNRVVAVLAHMAKDVLTNPFLMGSAGKGLGDAADAVGRNGAKMTGAFNAASEAARNFGSNAATIKDKILSALREQIEQETKAVGELGAAMSSADWGKASLEGAVKANQDYSAGLFGLSDIAADSEKAIDDFGDSIKNADGNIDASTLSFDLNTEAGRKQHEALKGIASTLDTQFAAAFADAHGNLDTFRGKANEISDNTLKRLQTEFGLSDDQVNDLRNSLGLTAKDWDARFQLSGTEEARTKIGLLQTAINDLPKDVQTRVNQEIIKGDYTGALATIQAYYNSHPLTVPVRYQVVPGNQIVAAPHAAGGVVKPGEAVSLVGEQGPELVSLPAGSRVYPAAKTKEMLSGGNPAAKTKEMLSGGNAGVTYEIHVHAEGTGVAAVMEAQRRALWLAGAKPTTAGIR